MSAKTYDRQSGSFLAAIGQNMPDISGDEMQEWIGNPKALQTALRKVFCPPRSLPTRDFPTWATLEVNGKTIDFVKVSVADLGFTKPVNRYDIYGRAKEYSLELLDRNMTAAVRDYFFKKILAVTIRMAMEPDCDREGSLVVCALMKDSSDTQRWGNWARDFNAEGDFELENIWLFARSEQKSLQAEEILSYTAVCTLRNSTTILAHLVKVGEEYFEVRTPATGVYNTMQPTEVKKINTCEVSLCPAITRAIEQARTSAESK